MPLNSLHSTREANALTRWVVWRIIHRFNCALRPRNGARGRPSRLPSGTINAPHMFMYKMHFIYFRHAPLRRPRVLSRTFGCGASKEAVGTLRCMPRFRPSTVAVLGALNVAELALNNKGLLSASSSQVGDMKKPTLCFLFVNSPPRSNTFSAVHRMSTSAKEIAIAATANIQQQQQYIFIGCRIPRTKTLD